MNSYQKLKKELTEVKQKLRQVAIAPDSVESIIIIIAEKHKERFEKLVWGCK